MRTLAATVSSTLVAGFLIFAPSAATETPNSESSPADYHPAPIQWESCNDETLALFGAECGYVIVPLDYSAPGDTIRIAVSRIKHSVPDDQYQGIMLVNPGGPGGSGLIYSILGNFIPGGVGAAYDWIGFDPRGVGSSEPSLSCDGNYFDYPRPQYIPYNRSIEQIWLQLKVYRLGLARPRLAGRRGVEAGYDASASPSNG